MPRILNCSTFCKVLILLSTRAENKVVQTLSVVSRSQTFGLCVAATPTHTQNQRGDYYYCQHGIRKLPKYSAHMVITQLFFAQ